MTTHDLRYTFSDAAQAELITYINQLTTYEKLELVPLPSSAQCPLLITEIEVVRNLLESGPRIVIVEPLRNLKSLQTIFQQRTVAWIVGNLLGSPLVQNEAGDQVICVYDRDRENSMAQGARYHQTREGGTIHTDNVNIPSHWDYLVLACIHPAMVGGETILVNGLTVHKILAENYPDALKILESNFIWEKRGIANETYTAPIISYTQHGEPLFRHLRPYLESAHRKTGIPLTPSQRYALDTLDAILEDSDNQYRCTLTQGEILLTYDAQVFHGRTCFSDALAAIPITDYVQRSSQPMKRTMDRLWIRK